MPLTPRLPWDSSQGEWTAPPLRASTACPPPPLGGIGGAGLTNRAGHMPAIVCRRRGLGARTPGSPRATEGGSWPGGRCASDSLKRGTFVPENQPARHSNAAGSVPARSSLCTRSEAFFVRLLLHGFQNGRCRKLPAAGVGERTRTHLRSSEERGPQCCSGRGHPKGAWLPILSAAHPPQSSLDLSSGCKDVASVRVRVKTHPDKAVPPCNSAGERETQQDVYSGP